jgi:hypothetical protein
LRKDPENGWYMFLVNVNPYLPDSTQIVVLLPEGLVLPDLCIEENEEDNEQDVGEKKDVKRQVMGEEDVVRAL